MKRAVQHIDCCNFIYIGIIICHYFFNGLSFYLIFKVQKSTVYIYLFNITATLLLKIVTLTHNRN